MRISDWSSDVCSSDLFTHLQQAQPIVFAHHLLAHAQSMLRDVQRLVDWDIRTALSPLGAAAMAGSAIARLPQQSAREMGYSGVCENSIDARSAERRVGEEWGSAGR